MQSQHLNLPNDEKEAFEFMTMLIEMKKKYDEGVVLLATEIDTGIKQLVSKSHFTPFNLNYGNTRYEVWNGVPFYKPNYDNDIDAHHKGMRKFQNETIPNFLLNLQKDIFTKEESEENAFEILKQYIVLNYVDGEKFLKEHGL